MFKTWNGSAKKLGDLARNLERHLNEFADEVISVSYSADGQHHVLAVYRPIGLAEEEAAAVAVAERVIEGAQQA